MNFFINYYLNVSLIGSSTKNDRCQDVTVDFATAPKLHCIAPSTEKCAGKNCLALSMYTLRGQLLHIN